MINEKACCCALAGQTGGAIRVVLELFAPLFASRQKVETELWYKQRLRQIYSHHIYLYLALMHAGHVSDLRS